MLTDWDAILASLAIVNAMIAVWNLWRGERMAAFGTGFIALMLMLTIIENVRV